MVTFLHKLETSFHPKPHEKWGGSWLMWAAASGEADITDDLANGNEPGGTTLEAVDEHGFTAAFWAAQMGNMDALKVLVKRGADLTVKSHRQVDVAGSGLATPPHGQCDTGSWGRDGGGVECAPCWRAHACEKHPCWRWRQLSSVVTRYDDAHVYTCVCVCVCVCAGSHVGVAVASPC